MKIVVKLKKPKNPFYKDLIISSHKVVPCKKKYNRKKKLTSDQD